MDYQTRSEENGINFFDTLGDAIEAAENDVTIWKISFGTVNFIEIGVSNHVTPGERIRLVRDANGKFYLSQLMDEIQTALNERNSQ